MMLNKKMLISSALLSMLGLGFAGQVFADEGDSQTIEGIKGETSADVITRGNLGKIDPTDPITPLPEGDDRWIKVTLPTAVVFESTEDQTGIKSSDKYEILNESGRPVKVDVTNYNITGGNGVKAMTSLNIKRSAGYKGNENVNLVSTESGAEIKNYEINQEFVRLANTNGDFGDTKNGDKSTNFQFTGTMNKDNLKEEQNFVESKLTFKFTALRMDGLTIEEAKDQGK
ncbi:hypothetical protein [Enterococcus faecalis]|uniref:VE28 n=2 Tax=Enterococcus faecalis TaxID=1351 RepID=C4P4K5_ENTFL|nr:hypothetical protein [Enterococcus faecalis]ACQ89888.1 VE28 [Enterococcus faecalis]MDE3927520.1 hypothetical protein [Enterococcus faecalis]